jgi:large subunit ribosomal protein L5
MYEFLERLIYIALPRVRDFKGYQSSSFDANFNLSVGIKEHLVFRELSYDKIYKTRGLDISFNLKNLTSSEMSVDFLKLFNFPIK